MKWQKWKNYMKNWGQSTNKITQKKIFRLIFPAMLILSAVFFVCFFYPAGDGPIGRDRWNDKNIQTPNQVGVSWMKISDDVMNDIFEQVTHPSAVYVASENKTFITWQSYNFGRKIAVFDNEQERLIGEENIGGTRLVNDGHGASSLVMDKKGYIYVFYGSHGEDQYYKKSQKPYDIHNWSDERKVPDMLGTYPNPWLIGDNIWLLYRTRDLENGSALYYKKLDVNDEWGDEKIIVRQEGGEWYNYFRSIVAANGDLHLAWTYYHWPNLGYFGVYHILYDVSENKWKIQDGSEIHLPADKNSGSKIFEGGNIWLWDIQIDAGGNPFILFGHSETEKLKIAKWKNNGWVLFDVIDLPWDNIRHFSGALIVDDPMNLRMAVTSENKRTTMLYKSVDGGETWNFNKIIGENTGREYYCCHKTVVNGRPNMEFVLSVGEGAAAWGEKGNYFHYESAYVADEEIPCKKEMQTEQIKERYREFLEGDLAESMIKSYNAQTLYDICTTRKIKEIKRLAEELK